MKAVQDRRFAVIQIRKAEFCLGPRVVAVPSLWPRPGGVLQQHGLGVLRTSGV